MESEVGEYGRISFVVLNVEIFILKQYKIVAAIINDVHL